MREPNYAEVLTAVPTASPRDLGRLLRQAAEPLGAFEVVVYLVDFERVSLRPVLLEPGADERFLAEEDVASSAAGRVFRTGEPLVASEADGVHLCVPLVERGDRTGVLSIRVTEMGDQTLKQCLDLGVFAGLLVRSFSRFSDLLHLSRRRRRMTLAAGLQWDLLPPLTIRSEAALVSGLLEPAYEIAGDVFDYAMNDPHLDLGLFDGMGHGVRSALLATLAVGAYRHARRGGEPLDAMYSQIDETLGDESSQDEFATGLLARLDLRSGLLEWMNAGHPRPLLFRGGRSRGELGCAVSLPFGLESGRCEQVAREVLAPGDEVLFFTDGTIEARSAAGEELGIDGLAYLWERETDAGGPPEEVLRRVTRAVVGFSAAKLGDDATLVVLHWYGGTRLYG